MGVAGSMSLMTTQNRVSPYSTTELDVPIQNFLLGFPGYPNLTSWFGLCYSGSWKAPVAGAYTFVTVVDDSVAIWIDGKLVGEDDDGVYYPTVVAENPDLVYNTNPVPMSMDLAAGTHSVRIMYYQGWPVALGIQLWVVPPGQAYVTGSIPPDTDFMQLDPPPTNGSAMACP
jgi:hypothetical protein